MDVPTSVSINMHSVEARQQERVTFFLLPVEREQIPVWVFVPTEFQHGIPALVMNLSASGIQVFTPTGVEWGSEPLRLHLLDGEGGAAVVHQFSARVRRLWRRTVSHSGDLHGLVFLDSDDAVENYLRLRGPEPRSRNWVRCVLEPVGDGSQASGA